MPCYQTNKETFLETFEGKLKAEDMQTFIDKVNNDVVEEEAEKVAKAALVKAVTEAKKSNNQVKFAEALSSKLFGNLNEDLMISYFNKVVGNEESVEEIQELIDIVNTDAE